MATNHNFRIKNGLEVGGTVIVSSDGVMTIPTNSTGSTQDGGTNNTRLATTAFVQQEITSLIGGAPGSLDTLNELAAAINDDASYASTLTTALATKLPLAGGTITSGTSVGLTINHDTFGAGLRIHRNHANNAPSIQFLNNSGSQGTLFALDSDDSLYWRIGTSTTNNKIFHDAYHPNADKWTSSRTLTLAGDLSGNVSFDGSANFTLTATVADDSHNHVISNVDGLQSALDAKAPLASPSFTSKITTPQIHNNNTISVLNGSAAQGIKVNSLYAGTSYSNSAPSGMVNALNGFQVANSTVINSSGNWVGGGNISEFTNNSGYITASSSAVTNKLPLAGGTMTGAINAGGGINGLTLSNGISGNNFNITGVNQLTINDPGEGIVFGGGSTTMSLAIVDDATDRILRYSGTGAVFDVQGNITLTGTVTATGGNSTNWNTAHGWGNHASAGYITASSSAVTNKLPLAGGTMTGKLTLNDAGYSLGNEYHKWKRAYTVNTSSPQEILYSDGNSLPTGGVYRFTAHISGTGTDQFATAVYWNQNGTWRINVTGQSGTSSNHPEFIIDGTTNKPTIHIDHSSNYGIHILGERIELDEGTGTDNAGYAFGTDAFLGSVNNNLYFLPGGSAATGQNSYDDGNVVWHTGNLTTTNKANYDTAVTVANAALPKAGGTMTGTINAGGGINGLTLSNGISGSNFDISGVNQLTINDPGEGIVFGGGSTTMSLAIVDDATDRILRYSGTGAVFDVQGNITLDGTVDGRDVATDGTKLDTIDTNADVTPSWVPSSDPGYITDGNTNWNNSYGFITSSDSSITNKLPLAGGTITGNLNVNGTTTLGNGPSDQTHINDTLYLGATDSGDSHFYFGENSSNWYGDHWYWDSGHEVERYSRHAGTDTLIEKHNTQYTHKVQTNRAYERLGHATGYQIGSYNSVAANSTKTNPIYTIGDNYRPSDTSVSGMYGIGYAHSNLWGTGSGKTSGWGQYVVEAGAYTQIFSVGGTWSLGEFNRNGNKVWDAGNDGSGSGLDADTVDGLHKDFLMHYKGQVSGDWDTIFSQTDGHMGVYQVTNTTGGGHSNYPTTAYSYGGVLSWQLADSTFKLYAPHTGQLHYQTGWNNDEYSGWRKIWDTGNDGSGSGLDADLLDGQHASAFIQQNTGNLIDLFANQNGTNELRLDNNRQDSGNVPISKVSGRNSVEVANMTFYRGGGGSSGFIRFQNKPTNAASLTDVFQVGDGGTVGYGVDILAGGLRIGGNEVINSSRVMTIPQIKLGDGNDGYFYSDSNGRTAFAGGDFYIQNSVTNSYNYATNQYIGDSSGDNIYFRSNVLSGTGWGIDGAGKLNTRDHLLNAGYHLQRADHHSGHLEGSYNNVAANGPKSNPIYTIGSSYNPSDAAFGNMYGIGFCSTAHTGISFTGQSNWGMYVAADGDARVWLDGSAGVVSSTGQHYVGSSVVWNAGNDGAGSGLDADLLDGMNSSSSVVANTIVARQGSGYIYANHINFSTSEGENPTINSFFTSNGDGWSRKSTKAHVISQLGLYTTSNDGSGSGLDADLLDGRHLQQIAYYQSGSDFANGTLVTTDIVSSGTNGDSFVIEITGKAYGSSRPHSIIAEGYLYNSTIINTNGTNISGSNFTYIKVMNNNGYLSFWWPRHGYWNSYNVHVRSSSAGTSNYNRVTAIANSADPSGATKKIQINLATSWNTANDGAGSGLDADLLDGQHGSYYAPASHVHSYLPLAGGTLTGNLNLSGSGNHIIIGGSATSNHYNSVASTTGLTFGGGNDFSNYSIGTTSQNIGGNYTKLNIKWHTGIRFFAKTNYGGVRFHSDVGMGTEILSIGNGDGHVRVANNLYANGGNLVWNASNDGSGSGLDADLLDGQHGSYYYSAGNPAPNQTITLSGAVTGSGTTSISTSNPYQTSVTFQGSNGNSPDSAMEYTQASGVSDSRLAPSTDWYNKIRMGHGDPYNYYGNTIAVKMTGTGYGDLYTMTVSNNSTGNWNKHWHANNDGSGSGLDADLLDGQHGSYYGAAADSVLKNANTMTGSAFKLGFHSGSGGTTFGTSHYSMGVDIANGSWSGTNYSDLIIGYHTGIRIGAGYSGIRFYNNSPTTDTNNTGNGNGGEALLMTIGGGGTTTSGAHVTVHNNLTVNDNLYLGDGNDGYFYSDTNGRTAFAGGDFYIQSSVGNCYIYATNTYLGDSSGDTIRFRGNVVTANSWGITAAGVATFAGVTSNVTGNVTGSSGSCTGNAATVTQNHSDGNGSYPILWKSGSTTYYTDEVFINASTNSIQAFKHICQAGTDNGIGFWGGHSSYAIKMGDNQTNHGTVTDYSMHHMMGTTSGRGFTFGSSRTAVTCSINALTGAILSSNNITAYSDIRVKDNIEVIPNALDKIKQLSGYTFTRTDVEDKEQKYTGVIAQEVLKVLPEAVQLGATEEDTMSVAYGNMVGLLIESIKELKAEVDDLKTQLSQKEN